jgi:hypothetical protein
MSYLPGLEMSPNGPRIARKKNLVLRWLLLIVSAFLFSCVCCVAGGWKFSRSLEKAAAEQRLVEVKLDIFMERMEAGEFDEAYLMISSRSQQQYKLEDLIKLAEDPDLALFDGYKGLMITEFSLKSVSTTDKSTPQGEVAELVAVIYYEDGFIRKMEAAMEKENNNWRLASFNISDLVDENDDYHDQLEG